MRRAPALATLALLLGACGSDPVSGSRVEDDAGSGDAGGSGGAQMADAGGSTGGAATGGSDAAIDGTGGAFSQPFGHPDAGSDSVGTGGAPATADAGSGGAAGTGGAQGTGGAPAQTYRTCMQVNGWEANDYQFCVNNAGKPLFMGGLSGLQCLTCLPTPFMLHDEECTIPTNNLCVKSCSECAPL
jgi:hypothetical protein